MPDNDGQSMWVSGFKHPLADPPRYYRSAIRLNFGDEVAFGPIERFVTIKLARYCFRIDDLIEVSYFTVPRALQSGFP